MADCVTVRESETTHDLRRLLGEGTGVLQSGDETNYPIRHCPPCPLHADHRIGPQRPASGETVIVLDDQDRENEGSDRSCGADHSGDGRLHAAERGGGAVCSDDCGACDAIEALSRRRSRVEHVAASDAVS